MALRTFHVRFWDGREVYVPADDFIERDGKVLFVDVDSPQRVTRYDEREVRSVEDDRVVEVRESVLDVDVRDALRP